MTDRKRKMIRLIEAYINGCFEGSIQEWYGSGSSIRIKDIQYSTNSHSIYVDSAIILGDVISESYMDREMADILIQDALSFFYPDNNVTCSVMFDV